MGVLADLDAAMATDLATVDESNLKTFGSLSHAGRKAVAGFMTRLAAEAKRREATRTGAAAE